MTLANKDNLLHTGFSWPEVLELERQVTPLAVLQTADPGATNDNTQGYGPGSIWINTANNREWTCVSAAAGAAIWSFSGAVLGNAEPSGIVTQFGAGTGSFAEEGNLYRHAVSSGIQTGGTTANTVLDFATIPANSFDQTGRGLQVTAAGSFAATSNNKTITIQTTATLPVVGSAISGGTVIASTGTVTTSGGGWEISANIFKCNASNTQIALHSQAQVGGAVSALQAPTTLSITENQVSYVAICASTPTAGTDVNLFWTEVNAMN